MAKATQRLYIDADGKLVDGDSGTAAFLLVAEGEEIPEGYEEPKAKQASKPRNKQAAKPADKSDADA